MIGEIYRASIQGTHCGAPFSVNLSYAQIQPLDDAGLALATAWCDGIDTASPLSQWLAMASNKLAPRCFAWSSPTDVGAAIIDSRQGEIATAAMPPTSAVLFHLRPRSPWPGAVYNKPKYDVGRFYLPGLVMAQVDRFLLTSAALTIYRAFGTALLELEVDSVPTFRLVAFPEFVAHPDGELTVRSAEPDSIIRRIKTRRPNTCELYAGTGQTGGRPMVGAT